MPFSQGIKEEALIASARRCCVCHDFAGRAVNVHHIEQEADGGRNIIENAIVLCLRCHSEAGHYNPRHPIGIKYSPSELIRHRDNWWQQVKQGFVEPISARDTEEKIKAGMVLRSAFLDEFVALKEATKNTRKFDVQEVLSSAFEKHAKAIAEYQFIVGEPYAQELEVAWQEYLQEPGRHRFHHYIVLHGEDPSERAVKLQRAVENIERIFGLTR